MRPSPSVCVPRTGNPLLDEVLSAFKVPEMRSLQRSVREHRLRVDTSDIHSREQYASHVFSPEYLAVSNTRSGTSVGSVYYPTEQ